MKNKKFTCENVAVDDKRKIFFVSSAIDGHIISEEARTLREAIAEAFELYSDGGLQDGSLDIRFKGEDGEHHFVFFATIQQLLDTERRGYTPVWRYFDNNNTNEYAGKTLGQALYEVLDEMERSSLSIDDDEAKSVVNAIKERKELVAEAMRNKRRARRELFPKRKRLSQGA